MILFQNKYLHDLIRSRAQELTSSIIQVLKSFDLILVYICRFLCHTCFWSVNNFCHQMLHHHLQHNFSDRHGYQRRSYIKDENASVIISSNRHLSKNLSLRHISRMLRYFFFLVITLVASTALADKYTDDEYIFDPSKPKCPEGTANQGWYVRKSYAFNNSLDCCGDKVKEWAA